jgi:hypothetical protein
MSVRVARLALGCTLIAGSVAIADGRPAPAADQIPALRAEPLTQYRAYRRMHAQTERMDKEGWVEAWTELDANGFRYRIVSERGSEYVCNKVLKALLKREQEIIASGDPSRSALTTANYEFSDAGVQASGVRSILMKPKRKDTMLVDGRMVLTPDGSDLLRVEGRLVKNPSFWTSLVNIIRHYTRLNGVRVPIATESVANVKIVGRSRLDVQYDYESVNGRPVSRAARQMAATAYGR